MGGAKQAKKKKEKKKEANFQKSSPLLLHVGEKDSMHDDHETFYLNCEIYGLWIRESGHRKEPIFEGDGSNRPLLSSQSLLCNIVHSSVNIENLKKSSSPLPYIFDKKVNAWYGP